MEVVLKVFRIPISRFIGKMVVLGLLMLSMACRAESPSDTPAVSIAHAETNTDGPVASLEPDWPQWNGPRPQKDWNTTLDTCTGTVLFVL